MQISLRRFIAYVVFAILISILIFLIYKLIDKVTSTSSTSTPSNSSTTSPSTSSAPKELFTGSPGLCGANLDNVNANITKFAFPPVYIKVYEASEDKCKQYCIDNADCQAYNYGVGALYQDNNPSCILFSTTKENTMNVGTDFDFTGPKIDASALPVAEIVGGFRGDVFKITCNVKN